jgi:hypothetical protein
MRAAAIAGSQLQFRPGRRLASLMVSPFITGVETDPGIKEDASYSSRTM